MTVALHQFDSEAGFRSRVKAYKKRIAEIDAFLSRHPREWGRFQSEFNQEINGVFRDLMVFEKTNLAEGKEWKVYKMKNIFVKWFRKDFVRGAYVTWSLEKPYGYAGDHKIIDDIYKNDPRSTGLERLYDNYFQMSIICNAVRNRKEDFKRFVLNFLASSQAKTVKIMDLASGPCRDVYEMLTDPRLRKHGIAIHCVDNDTKAIDYAKALLGEDRRVRFIHQNAVRIALKKNVETVMETGYDFIYSMGLFDYLDTNVSIRLVQNLRKLLKPDGVLAVADVRDKFSNPSVYFMEWVADWGLAYRSDDSFREIFIRAGFPRGSLTFDYEQQGVIQYILARKS